MKIKVIASGSKGNCTYVECGTTKILIDVGINYTRIKNELNKIGVDPKEIDLVLITHIHSDHIKGLQILIKNTNVDVYSDISVYEELKRKINIPKFHVIDRFYQYKDTSIELFPLSHDVECFSYMITYKDKTLVYITDTGYLNKRYYDTISNKDIYIIEANHDENMLMNGPYPFILKQRIISDRGHLSNSTTGKILSKVIGNKTKYIYLAHLSEHNNTKTLAYEQVTKELKKNSFDLNRIIITDQDEATELVEV